MMDNRNRTDEFSEPDRTAGYGDIVAPLRTWAEIDLDAVGHNVKEVRRLIGDTKIIGIVKADAYGHGALACSRALQKSGVDFFATATIDEALELRNGGIEDPVLILGYTPPARFDELLDANLIQSGLSLAFLEKLSAHALKEGKKANVHLKVDTGMNRTGILYQDGAHHYDEIRAAYDLPGVNICGIFSHFPVSDDLGVESRNFTRHQMDLFNEVIDRLKKDGIDPGVRHIQNSYGILNYLDAGYDYCRPGLLYMGVTSDDSIPIASQPDFIPVMSLKTRVTLVKTIPAGATVSYGRHFTADKPTRIASLAIGYADGLPRMISNKNLEISIRGHRVPLVGNICMDQCMADITGFDDIQEGDIAVLVGRDGDQVMTVDEISRRAGTINNETLSALSKRVTRLYLESESQADKDPFFHQADPEADR